MVELSLGMWSGHCSRGVQSLLLVPCAAGTVCGMVCLRFLDFPASAINASFPEDFLEMDKACRVECSLHQLHGVLPGVLSALLLVGFQDFTFLGIFSLVRRARADGSPQLCQYLEFTSFQGRRPFPASFLLMHFQRFSLC